MSASDTLPINNLWFNQRMPLIAEQMATADRVMRAVGHNPSRWLVPLASYEIAQLPCAVCAASATIQIVEGVIGADYTVLLLPPGACPGEDADVP